MQNKTMKTIFNVSRPEAEAEKGLATLLVIAAHNALLFPTGGVYQQWVYLFHVQFFFLLPFFYSEKKVEGRDFINPLIRCYIPYLWLFIFTYFLFHLFIATSAGWQLSEIFPTLLYGEQWRLKRITGFHFLWFLPTYCTLTLLRNFYRLLSPATGRLFVILILLAIFPVVLNWNWGPWMEWIRRIPFQVSLSCYYFIMGLVARVLFQKIIRYSNGRIVIFIMAAFLFISSSIAFAMNYTAVTVAVSFFTPIAFLFLLLLSGSYWERWSFLRLLGRNSLVIYLVHVFVYNILIYPLNHVPALRNFFSGIVIFILTTCIALCIAIVIPRVELLRKVFLPVGIKQTRG